MKTTHTLTAALAATVFLSLGTTNQADADTGIHAPPNLGTTQKPAQPDLGTGNGEPSVTKGGDTGVNAPPAVKGNAPDLGTGDGSPIGSSAAGDGTGISAPPNLGTDQKPGVRGHDLGTDGPSAAATCRQDLTGDGEIGFDDLMEVLTNWGRVPFVRIQDPTGGSTGKMVRADVRADINRDGDVDFADLQAVLTNYGLDCELATAG